MKGLIFTYLLTYGGAAASLINPFIGFLVYVCFALVRPESMWGWALGSGGNFSRIVAIALLVGWAMQRFGDWNFGRAAATVWCLIGWMTLFIASAALAPNQAVAWADVETKLKIVLPFLAGVTLIKSIHQVRQLAWVIVISQGYIAFEMNLSYLSGFNRIQEDGFGGMDNNCVSIAMVCGAGFAFFLGLGETKAWRRWLCFAGAGLMAHCIMIAQSRGGMMALIAVGAVTFAMLPKRPIYFGYLLLALAVGLRLAGPSVWERFGTAFANENGEREGSAESRLYLWSACLDIMSKEPLLGIGPHHFPLIAHQYDFTKGKEAHTTWLQLAAECGIPCLLFLLGFYLITMWRLWLLSRQLLPVDPLLAMNCQMVIAALVGFMISAQFVTLIGLEIPYYVALVGAGLLMTAQPELARHAEWDDAADHEDHEELVAHRRRPAFA
jgi:O-antigen ligase